MFKNLMDFSYKRNWKEAVGFYLVFTVLLYVVYLIVGFIIGPILISSGIIYDRDQIRVLTSLLWEIMSSIYILVISLLLVKRKKIYGNLLYIVLIIVGVLLSGLIGMLMPAFLTTRQSQD